MSKKRVLIIEDDKNIVDLLSIHLNDLDCDISKASDGQTGFEMAMNKPFDLVVLDIMLPKLDGIQVCQKMRAFENHTPILMLTAKNEEIDKVIGLESGADDYLTKPFSVREFIARTKSILRRADQYQKENQNISNKILEFKNLSINLEKRLVKQNDQRIDLTPKEFELLALLAKKPGRVYNREELLKLIWGYEYNGYEHTVNSHINRLRAKIENDPDNPNFIQTSWGIGYRFNDEL